MVRGYQPADAPILAPTLINALQSNAVPVRNHAIDALSIMIRKDQIPMDVLERGLIPLTEHSDPHIAIAAQALLEMTKE